MNDLVPATGQTTLPAVVSEDRQFVLVTVSVGRQTFGIPVDQVRDALWLDNLAKVPLAPADVAGTINIRGRISTVIDVRIRLGMQTASESELKSKHNKRGQRMCVTIERGADLYGLLVDSVNEVITVSESQIDPNPANLRSRLREVSRGVMQRDGALMLVLDVETLMEMTSDSLPQLTH